MTQPRADIVRDLAALLADVIQDWDLGFTGGIQEDTRLVADLGFQSIDVVMLIGEIQRHYNRRSLPFERLLIREGGYVGEIRLGDLADFLVEQLGEPRPAAGVAASGGAERDGR